MVPPTELPSAIRLSASSRYLAILLGPAVGGGLMLLLGPAWGLMANVLVYIPFSLFVRHVHMPARHAGPPRDISSGLLTLLRDFARMDPDPRIVTMIVLAGASSFFVGNAFQAQMPEYAQLLGAEDGGARYSVLLAANAAGAILGVLLLEGSNRLRPSAGAAIVCAGLWGLSMALFATAENYVAAVALLVVAGIFSIAFTSIAQTLVQVLAPALVRGTAVGLFNTAMLGLRAGSGVTVGILGTFIGVRRSLELSSLIVVAVAVVLFFRDRRQLLGAAVTEDGTLLR
jgi:hypothetical protein